MTNRIKQSDVIAIATLADARIWNEQQDQYLWAEDKLAQHDISATWVGTLEWEYDRLLEEAARLERAAAQVRPEYLVTSLDRVEDNGEMFDVLDEARDLIATRREEGELCVLMIRPAGKDRWYPHA